MGYKGLITFPLSASPQEASSELASLPIPEIWPWQGIPNPFAQFLWEARPPGQWAMLLRFDEQLVTSNPYLPLEAEDPETGAGVPIDYAHIFDMLREHKAALLARVAPRGLIAVAVRQPGGPFTPCMPGYFAHTAIDARTLDREGVEHLSESGHEWPMGLWRPSIIGLQAAVSLLQPGHREGWLEKCPEGLWLLTVAGGKLMIYEVQRCPK